MGPMNKLTPTQYWKIGIATGSSLCLLFVILIWLSGASETQRANDNGLRLVVTLENGAVEGKQAPGDLATDKKEEPANSPSAKSPEPSPTPTPTPTTDSSTSPATDSTPSPTPTPEASPTPAPAASPAADASPVSSPSAAANPPTGLSDALSEKSANGALPTISADGTKPWKHYAKNYVHKGNVPIIAVVVTGLGQNKSVTDMAIKMPENFSLSFNPYAKEFPLWTSAARAAGHEILIDLPLEPSNYPASDPGPYGLLIGNGNQANTTRLEWLMSRGQGYVGFVTPQNDAFSTNAESVKALLWTLEKRGLMILMAHEPAKNDVSDVINNSKAAYATSDMLIDEELSATAIQSRLLSLQKTASKRGFAIGIAQPFPLTLQQLSEWANKQQKEGFEIVPLTNIVGLKFDK